MFCRLNDRNSARLRPLALLKETKHYHVCLLFFDSCMFRRLFFLNMWRVAIAITAAQERNLQAREHQYPNYQFTHIITKVPIALFFN